MDHQLLTYKDRSGTGAMETFASTTPAFKLWIICGNNMWAKSVRRKRTLLHISLGSPSVKPCSRVEWIRRDYASENYLRWTLCWKLIAIGHQHGVSEAFPHSGLECDRLGWEASTDYREPLHLSKRWGEGNPRLLHISDGLDPRLALTRYFMSEYTWKLWGYGNGCKWRFKNTRW